MDAPSFDRRNFKFNLRMVRAAFEEYKRQHPEQLFSRDITNMPPPSELPPEFLPLSPAPTNPPPRPPPNSLPTGPDNYE
jgi:hypothetical protein